MCVTNGNFIVPAAPVRGLSISQNGFDRMKLVRKCTILIILQSRKNILLGLMFEINVVSTMLDIGEIMSRIGSRVCLLNTNKVFVGKYKKYTYSQTRDVTALHKTRKSFCTNN